MFTLFSIPKAFEGHIGTIQRNALASWRGLHPSLQIILLGNEIGVKQAAEDFGAHHEAEIRTNGFGTPLVSDAFARATQLSRYDIVMFTNADMLFDQTLPRAVLNLERYDRFILSGQRCDLDVTNDLSTLPPEGWAALFASSGKNGHLHGPSAMDYFVFPKHLPIGMPDFAIGRVGWDAWVIWKCRRDRIPVVDATGSVTAIHQNHSYASLRLGYQHWRGPERDLNLKMAGGHANLLTLREASHCLAGGVLIRPRGVRAITSWLATWRLYHRTLALKRWVLERLHA